MGTVRTRDAAWGSPVDPAPPLRRNPRGAATAHRAAFQELPTRASLPAMDIGVLLERSTASRRRRNGATRGAWRGHHGNVDRGQWIDRAVCFPAAKGANCPTKTSATHRGGRRGKDGTNAPCEFALLVANTSSTLASSRQAAAWPLAHGTFWRDKGAPSTAARGGVGHEGLGRGLRRAAALLMCSVLLSARQALAREDCSKHATGAACAHRWGRAPTCSVPWGRPWCRRAAVCDPL